MVQFLPIIFFLGFLQFLLGFSKVPVFFVSPCIKNIRPSYETNVSIGSIAYIFGSIMLFFTEGYVRWRLKSVTEKLERRY